MSGKKRTKPVHSPAQLKTANPQTTTCRQYFGGYANRVNGIKYGLELEVEGYRLASPDAVAALDGRPWRAVVDNSLRAPGGEEAGGREYISRNPMSFKDTVKALGFLDESFDRARTEVVPSARTSTHIHVNMQDQTLSSVVCLMMTYFTLEPLLAMYCGPSREANHFALQAADSPVLIDQIEFMMETRVLNDEIKYSGLNVAHLTHMRFGTVEFRLGAGIEERPSDCIPWFTMVDELVTNSISMGNPVNIIEQMSAEGASNFVRNNFPGIFKSIMELGVTEEVFENECRRSYRVAQSLAYNIDWSDYTPEK